MRATRTQLDSILTGMGFSEDRINAALAVLKGNKEPEAVDQLLKPKRLANTLDISESTLRRIDPPHVWVGKRKRFRLKEVMDFMQEQRR